MQLSKITCVIITFLLVSCSGFAANAQGLTLYLSGTGSNPDLSETQPSDGASYERTVWNSTQTVTFDNYSLSDDITGTAYTFNLLCASTATRDFATVIIIDGVQIAVSTFSVSGLAYSLYSIDVIGIDPTITDNAEVILEVSINGNDGAISGIIWGDTNPTKAHIILPPVAGAVLDPPQNLQAQATRDSVILTWEAPSGGGAIEELIYDHGTPTGAYSYNGNTMATHMSPSGPCRILSLKYYTSIDTGSNSFNAELYDWNGSQPGTSLLYSTPATAVDDNWVEVDISAVGISLTSDFVVGFGSMNETTYLGFDANHNNGRSWDFVGGNWSQWSEAYFIRAVVQYTTGERVELTPISQNPAEVSSINNKRSVSANVGHELKQAQYVKVDNLNSPNIDILETLTGYNIYRDSTLIDSVTGNDTIYIDTSLSPGTYCYTVTAVYNEGESDSSNQACATVVSTRIDDQADSLPQLFFLEQNVPNPLNTVTTISYQLLKTSFVNLSIYNIGGQLIHTLVNTTVQSGYHSVQWNARGFSPGEYMYRLTAGEFSSTRRCLLLK